MGNATNICSDKTGTLTENRMTVVEGWFAGRKLSEQDLKGGKFHPTVEKALIEQVCLNRLAFLILTDAEGLVLDRPTVVGSNTEGALLLLAKQWGFNYNEVQKIAFDETKDKLFAFNSDKKRSTVLIHNKDGTVTMYTKGASEWVIRDCSQYLDANGGQQPMSEEKRAELMGVIDEMASRALRTLCLAHKTYDSPAALPVDWKENPPDRADLCCDGIVGIMDPLRPDVIQAVAIAQRAGVTIRMVTGDNLATACAIARSCGILTEDGIAIEGPEFRAMSPADLDVILPKLQVLGNQYFFFCYHFHNFHWLVSVNTILPFK
jgi:magnesium-transporting ATPase (P-type)